jgi:hypothetical protein
MLEFSLRVPRRTLIFFCVSLMVAGMAISGLLAYRHFASNQGTRWSMGKTGPWGRLLYTDIQISVPDEFVPTLLPTSDQPPASWLFTGCTKEQVMALLDKAGISGREHDAFNRDDLWRTTEVGARLTPDDKTVLGLSPSVRAAVYDIVFSFPENGERLDPVWFDPSAIDRQLKASGLSAASIKLLKRLLYRSDNSPLLRFADRDVALRQIHDAREQRLFIQAISQKNAVVARLELMPTSKIEELTAYWGGGNRNKDLVPLLQSLQRVGDWNASIVYLLPPFMRSRLNTYPFPSANADAVKQDCFWTAFNALSEEPDNRLNDMQYVGRLLESDYYTIYEPSRLGDIVFITTDNNQVIHAAAFVADDLVFTKNGYHCTQPWLLMHMKDMLATYAVRYPNKHLRLQYYRKKG